jgi:hypothetical protein
MNGAARIRKQVANLRPAISRDFRSGSAHSTKRATRGKTRRTVKPRPDLDRAEPAERLFFVRTEFISADGTRFEGYASPTRKLNSFTPGDDRHGGRTSSLLVRRGSGKAGNAGGQLSDPRKDGDRVASRSATAHSPNTAEPPWRARSTHSCTTSRWEARRSSESPDLPSIPR